jgi:hypothetical protein
MPVLLLVAPKQAKLFSGLFVCLCAGKRETIPVSPFAAAHVLPYFHGLNFKNA